MTPQFPTAWNKQEQQTYIILLRVGILPHRSTDFGHRLHANDAFESEIGHVCRALAVGRSPINSRDCQALPTKTIKTNVLVVERQRIADQVVCPSFREVVL